MPSLSLTSHAVGALINIDVRPDGNTLVPMTNMINVTYNCSVPSGDNAVWQLDEFQLLDRDQFMDEGIRVQEHQNEHFSEITIKPDGTTFLTRSFKEMSFDVRCLAIVDEVNVEAEVARTVVLYGKLLFFHPFMVPFT